MAYSPWGHKELGVMERLNTVHFSTFLTSLKFCNLKFLFFDTLCILFFFFSSNCNLLLPLKYMFYLCEN